MDPFYLAALAAAVWGAAAFVEKLGVTGGEPLAGVLARTCGVVAASLVFAFFSPEAVKGFTRLSWKSALCFAAGGALASVLGQVFFYQALRKTDIGRAAAVGGAWPAFAFILGILFLGEPLSWRKSAGAALVVAGVALLR